MELFYGLGTGFQIDEKILNLHHEFVTTLSSLSLNQKLLLTLIALIALTVLSWFIKRVSSIFYRIRRWLRRKAIPETVNLCLDRDSDTSNIKNEFENVEVISTKRMVIIFIGTILISLSALHAYRDRQVQPFWDKPSLGNIESVGIDIVKHYDENTLNIRMIEVCMRVKHDIDYINVQIELLQSLIGDQKRRIEESLTHSLTQIDTYNSLVEKHNKKSYVRSELIGQWNKMCNGKRYYLNDYQNAPFKSVHF